MDDPELLQCFEALAHPTRLSAVRALVKAGLSGLPAGALAEQVSVPGPTLTFHLAPLVQSGLISVQRKGRLRVHTIDLVKLRAAGEVLVRLTELNQRKLSLRLYSPREQARYVELLSEAGIATSGLESGDMRCFAWGAAPAVAYGAVQMVGKVGVIRSIVVQTDERGKGQGTALLQALIAYCKDRGANEIWAMHEGSSHFLKRLEFAPSAAEPAALGSVRFAMDLKRPVQPLKLDMGPVA
jgi:DNA-binding transcriptional ArsR family regulator